MNFYQHYSGFRDVFNSALISLVGVKYIYLVSIIGVTLVFIRIYFSGRNIALEDFYISLDYFICVCVFYLHTHNL